MKSIATRIRCKHCGTQLASHDPDGLCIRRGGLEATVTGTDFTVSARCYRCGGLNVLGASPQRHQRIAQRPGAAPA